VSSRKRWINLTGGEKHWRSIGVGVKEESSFRRTRSRQGDLEHQPGLFHSGFPLNSTKKNRALSETRGLRRKIYHKGFFSLFQILEGGAQKSGKYLSSSNTSILSSYSRQLEDFLKRNSVVQKRSTHHKRGMACSRRFVERAKKTSPPGVYRGKENDIRPS